MDLMQELAKLDEKSCAQNTTDSYEFAWKIWGDFVEWAGLHATPPREIDKEDPTVDDVRIYVLWMQRIARGGQGYKPATMKARVAGLTARLQKLHPHKMPVSSHPAVKTSMKAAVNEQKVDQGVTTRKMAAITPDILKAMLAAGRKRWGTDSLLTIRNEALLTVGWSLGARASEIVSLERRYCEAVVQADELKAFKFTWPKAKAKDAAMKKVLGAGELFDPVSKLQLWLDASRAPLGVNDMRWPVFRAVSTYNRDSGKKMTTRAILVLVRSYLTLAGYDAKSFGAHSLRSGIVTTLARRGLSVDKIMNVTKHQAADTVIGYIRATGRDEIEARSILWDENK